jgi:predicted Ser/Thr protein kinase
MIGSQRRDVFIVNGEVDAWTYQACVVDSAYEAKLRTLEIVSNTTKLKDEASFLNGPQHDDVTAIRGLSICGYAGLFNTATLYNVILNETLQSSLDPDYWTSPSYAIWFNNQIVTFLYTGTSIVSRVNATSSGPFSYFASNDTMQFIGAWEVYLDPNGNGYFVSMSLRNDVSDEFVTVIDKCTTMCSRVQNITGTAAATFSANSTHFFSCFKEVMSDGSGLIVSGTYKCMIEGDSTRYAVDQLAVDYPITDTTGSVPLHSCMVGESSMIVIMYSGEMVTYNLYALDTANGFNVVAKSAVINAVSVHEISCRDKIILVATNAGIDYWVYNDGTGFEFPPLSTNTSEPPILSPKVEVPITEQAVVPIKDTNTTTAVVEPDEELTIGLTVSLICGSALGVGIFLLVFLLRKRKKQRKYDQTNQDEGGTNYTPLDPIFAKTRFITFDALTITKEIGSGSFGKVCLGEWNGMAVAIKMSNHLGSADAFMAEARLTLAMQPHPNVVYTYGLSVEEEKPYIVLEYCEGGSLDKLLANTLLNQNEQRALVLGIAMGLVHLHENKIIHRDLASRNVLLKEGKPKISDFGMSRVLKGEAAQGQTNTTLGPIRWMAPESIRSGTYSPKSDVWSFAIVVSEIVTGKDPHLEEDQIDVAVRIRDEGYTPQIPSGVDSVLLDLMKMCWKFDPEARPTMQQVTEFLIEHF